MNAVEFVARVFRAYERLRVDVPTWTFARFMAAVIALTPGITSLSDEAFAKRVEEVARDLARRG